MANPPAQTEEARQAARDKALVVRRMRADRKASLKEGSLSLASLLEEADADALVAKMKVLTVIESLPGVGKVKARRTMAELGIDETRRLRGLGEHQRTALLKSLG